MAGRLWRPIIISIIIIILLSIAPENGTLSAHKKRSGITYVAYMVVTPLQVLETLLYLANLSSQQTRLILSKLFRLHLGLSHSRSWLF